MADEQFRRKATLIVAAGEEGIDLSELRFRFKVNASDEEAPNHAYIRVYNLAPETVKKITGRERVEFTRVILQAGYESNFGVIFDGTIIQYGYGKENATDTYFDIMAQHGDEAYNFGVCNVTLAAGSSSFERQKTIADQIGLEVKSAENLNKTGGILPRGKVIWGMARDHMRCEARSTASSWSIQDGKIQILPLKGYLPGEAVVLNSSAGLVGIPEQTDQGIKIRCLLNPRLQAGGLVQINNADINQKMQADLRAAGFEQSTMKMGQISYNKRAGLEFPADISRDGFYRTYVIEHVGDTRGQEWYSDIIGLAFDKSTDKVVPNE